MNKLRTGKLFLTCLLSPKGMQLLGYIALLLSSILVIFAMMVSSGHASSRIKDIVTFEGIRDNILIGYGLVVGLDGTGDRLQNSPFTEKSLEAFLSRLGVNTMDMNLNARNVAAVTVTGTLPPFSRSGSRIDVTVSTLGDARSLSGGTLVATPLMGPDGNLYAVAQGAVAIGGFKALGDSGSTVQEGVTTSGYISNGAIVEREIDFDLDSLDTVNLALRNPDVSTAKQIAQAINQEMNMGLAKALDSGTVQMEVPEQYEDQVAMLIAEIEQLQIIPDQPARILIDEASGTIVMNENVRIDTVAIAQGNLLIQIAEGFDVNQPNVLADGQTVVTPATAVGVTERGMQMAVLEEAGNLNELVDGLNTLGVSPRDLITILQSIKAAGALQADIEMR